MAVISLGKRWPNGQVPYVAGSDKIEEWLLEINKLAKIEIFIPKEDSHSNYLSAKTGNGSSDAIGFIKGCGEYKISAQRKRSMQHEALHALGFHHEQLHSGGPWGAFGTKARNSGRIDTDLLDAWGKEMANPGSSSAAPTTTTTSIPSTPSAPTTRRRSASITSGIKPTVDKNEAAMDAHKRSYDEAVKDTTVMHILSCDFSSVMMYPQMKAAAKACGRTLVETGIPAQSEFLSNGDIQALQYMYNTCTKFVIV